MSKLILIEAAAAVEGRRDVLANGQVPPPLLLQAGYWLYTIQPRLWPTSIQHCLVRSRLHWAAVLDENLKPSFCPTIVIIKSRVDSRPCSSLSSSSWSQEWVMLCSSPLAWLAGWQNLTISGPCSGRLKSMCKIITRWTHSTISVNRSEGSELRVQKNSSHFFCYEESLWEGKISVLLQVLCKHGAWQIGRCTRKKIRKHTLSLSLLLKVTPCIGMICYYVDAKSSLLSFYDTWINYLLCKYTTLICSWRKLQKTEMNKILSSVPAAILPAWKF